MKPNLTHDAINTNLDILRDRLQRAALSAGHACAAMAARAPFMARADRRYCWMIWKPGHTGPAAFWWLSTAPFTAPERTGL